MKMASPHPFCEWSPSSARRSNEHRAPFSQRHPSPHDSVDEPEPHEGERQPRDDQPDAQRADDEQEAERNPQQTEPERANLPSKMRLEPGASHVAPLHVVEDDRDDR